MTNSYGGVTLVANNQNVKHRIKQLQHFATWRLVVLLVLAIFIALTFLRLNNIGMVERRSAVLAADTIGDGSKTITRLYDLQRFVSAHMNTDMGKGLYLQSSYDRDVQKADNTASNDTNANGNIYKKAQEVCAPRFTRYSTAYLQCTLGELNKYPAASAIISSVNYPDPNTYLHVFVSPVWSPDFAGWSVLVSILLGLMIVTRIISVFVLRILLRRHYKSV
jgi:hypothetical protein